MMEIRILGQEKHVNKGWRGKAQILNNNSHGSNLGDAKGCRLSELKRPAYEGP